MRAVKTLIGGHDFKSNPLKSVKLEDDYNRNLLDFALISKKWTAEAQNELFKNIVLKNRRKTRQFLELVKESKTFEDYAKMAVSIRFGGTGKWSYLFDEPTCHNHPRYEMCRRWGASPAEVVAREDECEDLKKIAVYCCDAIEISCYEVEYLKVEFFSRSFYLIRVGDTC
jgi:hypothetical protein